MFFFLMKRQTLNVDFLQKDHQKNIYRKRRMAPKFSRIDDSLKIIIRASSENKMCHTNGGFKE